MRNINRWLSKTQVTHLLLDGGTLSAKEGFHDDYVADVMNGEKLFVVEKKTTHFRFFVDLDYTGDSELDFEKVVKEISKIVNSGHCVIAKAHPRLTPKGETKYGVHVIWPESIVNKQKANSIRIKILDEFGSEWEKIIDASVYSGSGLRMLWSYKKEDGSTPYVPWGSIDEHGTFKEFKDKSPSSSLLDLFSIRVTSTTDSFSSNVVLEDSSQSELEYFIRRNLPGQESAKVLRISKCKNKKDYWVRTNSKYCDNVKREHKSNHVWFLLSPNGTISQRCEDDECKKYKGRCYRIPSRLIPNERVLDTSSHRLVIDYLPDGWKLNQS